MDSDTVLNSTVSEYIPDRESLKKEVNEAIQRVIDKEDFILGEDVKEFERQMAEYIGVKHAIGLNSGTDALRFALEALKIKPGDEVITTPFSFVAGAEVIALMGAVPVFVDIDGETCNLDINQLESAITPKTKAINPVYLYGHPMDMDRLTEICKKYNLGLVEDCCQSLGATFKGKMTGSFGEFGCFSFYPTKTLGSYGDAGLMVTDDHGLAQRANMIRNHGSKIRYHHEFLGYSSRLDSIQAAVLRVKLKYFDNMIERTRRLARLYNQKLKGLGDIMIPPERDGVRHVYCSYTIRTSHQKPLQKFLYDKGIKTGIYYPVSIHLLKAFDYLGLKAGSFPESEKAQNEVLSLPLLYDMKEEEIEKISDSVREYFNGV